MIELIENEALPQVCALCKEVEEFGVDAACYNCDYALERFRMVDSEADNIIE